MKKFLALTFGIVLLAAACNKQVVNNGQNNQGQNQNQYRNDQYGFTIDLKSDWTGYTVLNQSWQGNSLVQTKPAASGPLIVIRHPKWTDANHYEDMPVMVFTPAQWNLVTTEKLSVGAAPIAPSKLDANANYVFALPARYNYDYATGWEEADQIIHTLKATGSTNSSSDTSTWKTYTNTKYNYSIKYPNVDQDTTKFDPQSKFQGIWLGGNANLLITVHPLNEDFSNSLRNNQYSPKENKYSSITFNGMVAQQKQSYGTMDDLFVTTLFTTKQYVYELEFSDVHNSQKLDLLTQVLNTFNFTDSISTANWKTYNWSTNPKANYFSLKYPASWFSYEQAGDKNADLFFADYDVSNTPVYDSSGNFTVAINHCLVVLYPPIAYGKLERPIDTSKDMHLTNTNLDSAQKAACDNNFSKIKASVTQ